MKENVEGIKYACMHHLRYILNDIEFLYKYISEII